MSKNSIFRFKQFSIDQRDTTLKITTDATIFGAWLSVTNAEKILDIGTGTGLLALMLAQKTNAQIHAVEIDATAAMQAAENFKNSPWTDRLTAINESIQQHATGDHRYDFILCNPPFFKNHLRKKEERENRAIHNDSLSLTDLASAIDKLLSKNGKAAIMLPPYEFEQFEKIMSECSFFITQQLSVADKPDSKVIRVMAYFSKEKPPQKTIEKLAIKDSDGQFSQAYSSLLKDYLLIF